MKQDETKLVGTSYKCQQCGYCCMYREEITVTPMDLLRYCKFFKLTPKEFLMRYTWKKSEYNNLPRIYLISKDDTFKSCIFFEVGRGCAINSVKPPVCYLYPLVDNIVFGSGEIMVHDKKCNNAKNLQNLSQKALADYINSSSDNRYNTEKIFIKKFIFLCTELELALLEKRPVENESTQKHIRKFFEDFYLNLDIDDEKYLENKFKEWEDIMCFI